MDSEETGRLVGQSGSLSSSFLFVILSRGKFAALFSSHFFEKNGRPSLIAPSILLLCRFL